MEFYIIVCHAKNRTIGKDGGMPWHIPEDLKRFKRVTLEHPTLIMGRKTFESLPERKPLPGRHNIVLSRSGINKPGFTVVRSVGEVMQQVDEKACFVMGGAQIYQLFLPLASRIYRTVLDIEVAGDTYFPEIDKSEWQQVGYEPGETTEYPLHFEILARRQR